MQFWLYTEQVSHHVLCKFCHNPWNIMNTISYKYYNYHADDLTILYATNNQQLTLASYVYGVYMDTFKPS